MTHDVVGGSARATSNTPELVVARCVVRDAPRDVLARGPPTLVARYRLPAGPQFTADNRRLLHEDRMLTPLHRSSRPAQRLAVSLFALTGCDTDKAAGPVGAAAADSAAVSYIYVRPMDEQALQREASRAIQRISAARYTRQDRTDVAASATEEDRWWGYMTHVHRRRRLESLGNRLTNH